VTKETFLLQSLNFNTHGRTPPMSIYVSGSVAFDRIMDFPGKFSDHILPDKIHMLNVCFMIEALRENFGGTAGNIAFSLSLLDEKPFIVAAAGKDFPPYRAWLEKSGLSCNHIEIVKEELTAGAYITTDRSDNQITAFNPGAMGRPTRFDPENLEHAAALAIIAPGNLDDMRTYAARFRDLGVPYIFDPGQSLPAWSADSLREAIRGSEILISNDYELEMIREKTGLSQEELLGMARRLITTRGEEGSEIKRLEEGAVRIHHIPAVPPDSVCDPTGAGDAYRAGLIKGLRLRDDDILHAARMGAVCAAYAVEVYGTQTFHFTSDSFNRRFHAAFGGSAF
jgi:adenosine kinase